MNIFDALIARNTSTSFNNWHDAIRRYEDVDVASSALYESAVRSPSLHVSFAYGTLVKLLAHFFDAMQSDQRYNADGEKALAGYVYRTFRLLSAMNEAQPDLELTSSFPVRDDIVDFLDNFILSLS